MNKAGGTSGATGYGLSPTSSPVDARGGHRLERDLEAQLETEGVFASAKTEGPGPADVIPLEHRRRADLPHVPKPQEAAASPEAAERTPTPPADRGDEEGQGAPAGDPPPATALAVVSDRNPGHFQQLAQALSGACAHLHIRLPSCTPLADAPSRLCRAMAQDPLATCLAVVMTGLLVGATVSSVLAPAFHGEKP